MPRIDTPQQLASIASSNLPKRQRAKMVLGSLAPDADIDLAVLMDGLKHRNDDVVFWCEIALARLGERAADAVPLLVPLINREPLFVRQSAIDTLVRVAPRDPIARAAVFGALRHADPDMRTEALRKGASLPNLTPGELAAIGGLATDPDPRVAHDAAGALRRIQVQRKPTAAEPLTAAKGDNTGDSPTDEFLAELSRCLKSRPAFRPGMRHMLRWWATRVPHPDWKKIAAIRLAADELAVRSRFASTLARETIPFPVRGLAFHLTEMADARDREFIAFTVAFVGQYDPKDPQFLWVIGDLRHDPERPLTRLKAVQAAGRICNGDKGKGLGSEVFYQYGLAFASLLAASLLKAVAHRKLGAPAGPIGVAAGWSDGDSVCPGELRRAGFVPTLNRLS